jgi:cytochrome P450
MPSEATEDYVRLATAQVHYDPRQDPDGSKMAGMRTQMAGHVQSVIDERRDQPQEDIVSALLECTVDDRPLTDDELQNIVSLLFLAGFDTTAGAIGEIIGHLATHPDDRDRLVAEPARIPAAIEESLRFYSNSGSSGRLVLKDAEIAGCPMRPGDTIFSSLQAANRDPRVFADPDVIDLERTPNRQVAFGMGVHRCLGSHVARAEIRVSVEEWLKRIPVFSLEEGATLEHMVSITTTWATLPLRLGAPS